MNEILTATNLAYITVALAIISFVVYQLRKGNMPQILTTTPPPAPKENTQEKLEQSQKTSPELFMEGQMEGLKGIFDKKDYINPNNNFENLLTLLTQKGRVNGTLTTEVKGKKAYGQKFTGTLTLNIGDNREGPQETEAPLTDTEIEELETQNEENMEQFIEDVKPESNGEPPTIEEDDKPEKPEKFWDLKHPEGSKNKNGDR